MVDLQTLDRESYAWITVTGRKSGNPHTVQIWFTTGYGKVYISSARGMNAQWVKNLRAKPEAILRIGNVTFPGTAVWREDEGVRRDVLPLFFRKYFLAKIFKWIGWYKQIFAFEITPGKP